MSLALWDFNWTWDGSAPTSTTSEAAVAPLHGGGHGRDDNTYEMLPKDYWDARAATLRSDAAKVKDATVLATDKADTTIIDASKVLRRAKAVAQARHAPRQELLAAMKNAGSVDEMKQISAKLRGNT